MNDGAAGRIAWDLEGSYRWWAVLAAAAGAMLLLVGASLGDPTAAFLSLPPWLLGIYLWRENPQEVIVFDTYAGRIWKERRRRGKADTKGSWRVREFDRLVLVRYRVRHRGIRAMLVLIGPGHRREKLDDRPFAPGLRRTAQAIAAQIGWAFTDYSDQLLEEENQEQESGNVNH